MNLNPYFKSIVEQDHNEIVICNLDHTIIYMNPAAIKAQHGKDLTGRSLLNCHQQSSNDRIFQIVEWFKADRSHNQVYMVYREAIARDQYMIALRDENGELIGYYEKHEYRTPETAKPYDLY